MKKIFVWLTAILLAGILSCAAFADIAPLPDDWDWGTPVSDEELTPIPDAKEEGENAGSEEGPVGETDPADPDPTDPEPADPEPVNPEPADPDVSVPKTGCSHLSVSLFVLCGGIVFIAAGILGFVIGRRGREVQSK